MDFGIGRPRLILLIDESVTSWDVIQRELQAERVELIDARNGQEGLAMARTSQPDLILLGLDMPDWNGFETISLLKDDPSTATIPVILLSAIENTETKAKGLDLGAADFLSTPFDPLEFRARVRAALRSKDMLDRLEQRAHLDALTGLGNRHALRERLTAEWSNCLRRGVSLALMIADLDRFKTINDRFGHSAGDLILQGAAFRLRQSIRGGDFAARYGGEEFVVVAPDCDLAGGIVLAERFRVLISEMPTTFNPDEMTITASVGVSASENEDVADPMELLQRADDALYQAKASGRDAVRAWGRAHDGVTR